MAGPWVIIFSSEVAQWFVGLPYADQIKVDRLLDRLRTEGHRLRMPHSRALGQGLYELRVTLQRGTIDQRVTYVFDTTQQIITLTAFRKTRDNERREIERARRAYKAIEE